MNNLLLFDNKTLQKKYDYLAPDGSEIRLFPDMKAGGLCHCTLPPFRVSRTIYHMSVEEIWYFISGNGRIWRKQGAKESVIEVGSGVCVTIPPKTYFQFRNDGVEALTFIIATMPPWPGKEGAIEVSNYWKTKNNNQ